MKKIIIYLCFCLLLVGCSNNEKIKLESKYYESNEYIDLDKKELTKLIKKEESFVLFIYQPMCVMSSEFEEVLNKYLEDASIRVCKISFSEMKKTSLKGVVRFYPSFVIFNKGEVVDFLDADSDEDTESYKEVESFKKWFESYIEIK